MNSPALPVQDCVQEVCAHQERDCGPEPHRHSKRDRIEAGCEPQQGAAHHTGGWGWELGLLEETKHMLTSKQSLLLELHAHEHLFKISPTHISSCRRQWRRRSPCRAPQQESTLWGWWFSPCASVWSSETWRSRVRPSETSLTAWMKPSWGWWPSSSGQCRLYLRVLKLWSFCHRRKRNTSFIFNWN